MARLLSWFPTKSGRIFTRCCVGAAALCAFGPSALHGPFLDKLKEVIQVYKHGKPRPLPPSAIKIIEEVLHDSSLTDDQKKKLQFFYVNGLELFHAGGIESPWGGIIGIPFFFEDMKNFQISDLRFPRKESLDWVIDGRDLLDAVIMSDNAKKFALMQTIYSCNYFDTLTNSMIGAGCVLLPARYAQRINVSSNAFEKLTFRQRSVRYAVMYFCGYIFYRLLKDPLKHLTDKKADQLAAETGPEYLDGGIEYYEKTLQKNKAVEDFIGSTFIRTYDEHGNENYLLLVPKLPTAKRLEILQNMKKEKTLKAEETNLE